MNHDELQTLLKAVGVMREAGFNCAEGVLWGVGQALGLDVAVSCVTGFGGGMGGTGSVCGALTGAIAALGVYVGRTEPDDIEGKNKCIALSKDVINGFQDVMESQICHEILARGAISAPKLPGQGINPICVQAVEVAIKLVLHEISCKPYPASN